MVYCIGNREQNICKIGYTASENSLKARIKSIQTGCAYPLEVLGKIDSGDKDMEATLHNLFIDNRLSGEWFSLTEDICQHFAFERVLVERLWVVYIYSIEESGHSQIGHTTMRTIFAKTIKEAANKAVSDGAIKGRVIKTMSLCIPYRVMEQALLNAGWVKEEDNLPVAQ